MEQCTGIQRSEVWKQIHEIVKQLPIKNENGCDAMDAPSAATEIEELFLKLLALQNVSNNEERVAVGCLICKHFKNNGDDSPCAKCDINYKMFEAAD